MEHSFKAVPTYRICLLQIALRETLQENRVQSELKKAFLDLKTNFIL